MTDQPTLWRDEDMFIGIGRSMLLDGPPAAIRRIDLSQVHVGVDMAAFPDRSVSSILMTGLGAIDAVSRRTRRAQASGRTARAQWLAIEHLRRFSSRGPRTLAVGSAVFAT